jgi:ABC-type lipoprotein export system ATPase subunit
MMVRLEHVSKYYGKGQGIIKAVDDITLSVEAGEFVMCLGHSGCGKTTLLNLVAGMTEPDQGAVMLDGINLSELRDKDLSNLRAKTLGFIFQFKSMLATLNALDNVQLPFLFAHQDSPRGRALMMLEEVGLGERASAYAHELSSGQQRRVGVARALIMNPPLLICDEPTGDLDSDSEETIMELIAHAHSRGAAVIMATHNQELCHYATRVIRIDKGRILSG